MHWLPISLTTYRSLGKKALPFHCNLSWGPLSLPFLDQNWTVLIFSGQSYNNNSTSRYICRGCFSPGYLLFSTLSTNDLLLVMYLMNSSRFCNTATCTSRVVAISHMERSPVRSTERAEFNANFERSWKPFRNIMRGRILSKESIKILAALWTSFSFAV